MRNLIIGLIALAAAGGIAWLFYAGAGPVPALGNILDPFHGVWYNMESQAFPENDPASLAGLHEPATVIFDDRRVPYIFANNAHDLYFLQGYVTARDRLWQMEFQTHAAAGRITEIVGPIPQAVAFDRLQRRLGMVYAAENALEMMEANPETKEVLDAYTEGINAWISSLEEKAWPVEYKLIGYGPEPWTNLKTALLLKYMAYDLTAYSNDVQDTRVRSAYGDSVYQALFPVFTDSLDPIIPQSVAWNFDPVAVQGPDSMKVFVPESELEFPEIDPVNGSNNWAVSGEKTLNGYPILANDPHLGLKLPSIWYEVQVAMPGMRVHGASLPGAPAVIIGFNDSIAWGVTNASRDVFDYYEVEFTDFAKGLYRFDGEVRQAELRIEAITIKGNGTYRDSVWYTVHGPVVYDGNFVKDGRPVNVAVRWVAHDPSNELLTFIHLNKGKNYSDYRKAIQHYSCPGQNFCFASASGDIALVQQGKFPAKFKDQGRFVMDGSDSTLLWQAFIPEEQNPGVLNPERGFVSSANQVPAGPEYPYHVYGNYEEYRNRRINDVLANSGGITPESMRILQNDNYNVHAADVLPFMLSLLSDEMLTEEEQVMKARLGRWDYKHNPGSVEPVVFMLWWQNLDFAIWQDEFYSKKMTGPDKSVTASLLMNQEAHPFYDNPETEVIEDRNIILFESYADAMKEFVQWEDENEEIYTWTLYKQTHIDHLVPQLSAFSIPYIETGGWYSIVNAMGDDHGPSWRMVVEMGPKPVAWVVYPGGQSGNPLSWYYDNMVEKWSNGEYYRVGLLSEGDTVNADIGYFQKFYPAK